MTIKKKIVIGLFIGFIAIQFIQPEPNESNTILPTDIGKIVAVPANVSGILRTSCDDCHSNNTQYPWYSFIQPGAWLTASHIKNGKAMLNFSQFGELSNRKQQSKLQELINQLKDDEMPLLSYKLIHQNAVLTPAQKTILMNWAASLKDTLSANN